MNAREARTETETLIRQGYQDISPLQIIEVENYIRKGIHNKKYSTAIPISLSELNFYEQKMIPYLKAQLFEACCYEDDGRIYLKISW